MAGNAKGAVLNAEGHPHRDALPRHIAIIMDGNGRWAAARGLSRAQGHRKGVDALRRIVRHAAGIGIEYLTLFSFSSENWTRPPDEIRELMGLLKELNQSQGTTFLVVTHDLNVARQTRRVLVMADGCIVREDCIGSPIEEDLKVWQHSGLGRRIMDGKLDELSSLEVSPEQASAIQGLLRQNSRGAEAEVVLQNR